MPKKLTIEKFNNLNPTVQQELVLQNGSKYKSFDLNGFVTEYWMLHDFMVELIVLSDGNFGCLEACTIDNGMFEIKRFEEPEQDESELSLAQFNDLCQEDQEALIFRYGHCAGELDNEKGTVQFWIMPNFYAEYYIESNGYPYKLKGFDDKDTLKDYEQFLDIVQVKKE